MLNEDKISQHQLMVTIFVALFSPIARISPQIVTKFAGKAAWISPIVAAVPLLLLGLVLTTMLKNRAEDEGMSNIIEKALGRIAGKVVVFIFGLWFSLYAGFVLRGAGERLLSTIYENGNIVFIILVTAALTLMAALGKVKAWARSGEVFFIILLIILAITFFFSSIEIKTENLWPVTYLDAENIFWGAIPIANTVSTFAYFTFLNSHVRKSDKEKKLAVKWTMYTLIGVFFIIATTVGNLGEQLTVHMSNPFFVMIKNITIFNVIERFEALVIGAWIITDFVFITGLIMCSSETLKNVTGAKKRNGFVWPCMAVMLAVAFFVEPNALKFKAISDYIIPMINILLIFVVIPTIFVVGKIRKKI